MKKRSSMEMVAGGEADSTALTSPKVALIIGATGLVGKALAKTLLAEPGWKVYGVARKPDVHASKQEHGEDGQHCCYQFISCDLLEPKDTAQKLSPLQDVTHVFWITWASQEPLDTPASYELNRSMLVHALDALLPGASSLQHISLQTGAKHYASPADIPPATAPLLYNEESPRVAGRHNFYYGLEDLLEERLAGCRVGWSVNRPGLILGSSSRTHFNFMGSLCVYATLCKYLDLPFVFGGSRMCWEEEYIDFSDARLVAQQLLWASTSEAMGWFQGEAFNVVNGPRFTWKSIWPTLAAKFGLGVPEPMFSPGFKFVECMGDKGGVWEEIVEKAGLRYTKMEELANWWFMDSLFRCQTKLLVSRKKADRLGFTASFEAAESILHWVDQMREDKLIP